MTPEERADRLITNHIGWLRLDEAARREITAAILDAEVAAADEALERAANVADQERDENDGRSDPAWSAANAIADGIRSLKSSSPSVRGTDR
jgi:hypothetical protein